MGFRMIQPKRIKKVKTRGSQEVLQRLQAFLNDSCDQTAEFLCGFWKDQQNVITYKELRQTVVAGTISTETLRLWQQDYSVMVANRFRNVWEDAMKAGAVSQPILEGKGFVFNTQTSGVMNWIQNRGAALVTSCTEEQKSAISALLSKKMIEGHTVDELSRMIRPCIGLTEGQAKANARYYDSIVANLKKEHPRMKPENIQKKAQDAAAKYAERQHRQRAMTIAQTESAFAYNRGADEGIRQAQEQGLLGQMMKRWSTSGDDAVCSICQGLEGVELGMDEEFQFKGRQLFAGQNLMPPAHPRCACAIEYVEVEGGMFEQQRIDIVDSIEDDSTIDYNDMQMKISFPDDITKIDGMTPKIREELDMALDRLCKEYEIKLHSLTIEPAGKGDIFVVGWYAGKMGMVINQSIDFNKVVNGISRKYYSGYLAGKSLEDYVAHEMFHVMLYQDCVDMYQYQAKYMQIERLFENLKGISGYADRMKSGNEALAEAFVRMRNGEPVPPIATVLVNAYIGRWKK